MSSITYQGLRATYFSAVRYQSISFCFILPPIPFTKSMHQVTNAVLTLISQSFLADNVLIIPFVIFTNHIRFKPPSTTGAIRMRKYPKCDSSLIWKTSRVKKRTKWRQIGGNWGEKDKRFIINWSHFVWIMLSIICMICSSQTNSLYIAACLHMYNGMLTVIFAFKQFRNCQSSF